MALLAGVGVGVWSSVEQAATCCIKETKTLKPNPKMMSLRPPVRRVSQAVRRPEGAVCRHGGVRKKPETRNQNDESSPKPETRNEDCFVIWILGLSRHSDFWFRISGFTRPAFSRSASPARAAAPLRRHHRLHRNDERLLCHELPRYGRVRDLIRVHHPRAAGGKFQANFRPFRLVLGAVLQIVVKSQHEAVVGLRSKPFTPTARMTGANACLIFSPAEPDSRANRPKPASSANVFTKSGNFSVVSQMRAGSD